MDKVQNTSSSPHPFVLDEEACKKIAQLLESVVEDFCSKERSEIPKSLESAYHYSVQYM